jgi:hypothetical protein
LPLILFNAIRYLFRAGSCRMFIKYLFIALLAIAHNISWAGGWFYLDGVDPMSSKPDKTAILTSTNSLNLSWPYAGENRGYIIIRQHPQWGLDVFVKLDKGQIICHYDDCRARVRFDSKEPVTYNATGPADHSSNIIFFKNEKAFIENARRAKTILVELNIFQNGSQILRFEAPQELVWK